MSWIALTRIRTSQRTPRVRAVSVLRKSGHKDAWSALPATDLRTIRMYKQTPTPFNSPCHRCIFVAKNSRYDIYQCIWSPYPYCAPELAQFVLVVVIDSTKCCYSSDYTSNISNRPLHHLVDLNVPQRWRKVRRKQQLNNATAARTSKPKPPLARNRRI